MKVLQIRALRGPNVWSKLAAIEATLVFEQNECLPDSIPGFDTRLREYFPDIALLQPVDWQETTLAHILAFITLKLQERAGCSVSFSRVIKMAEANTWRVVVEYSEEAVGRRRAGAVDVGELDDEVVVARVGFHRS